MNRRVRAPLALLTALVAAAAGVLLAAPADAAPACSTVEQVTSATGGFSSGAATNGVGGLVAFKSNRDLTGDNADLNPEIFVFDTGAGTTEQITDSTGQDALSSPSISENGRVAFSSDRDYTGGNADGGEEIFVWNGTTISQRTSSPDDTTSSEDPDISGDGTKVAFTSSANLTGGNPGGQSQIFRVNASGTPAITQLTSSSTQPSSTPSINDTGSRIAFTSFADLVPATGNSDNNGELFVVDPAGPTTVQLTNTTGGGFTTASPDITDDGTRVWFQSQQDLVGQNAGHNSQIYRRVIAGATTQVTHLTGGAASTAAIDATGARVAFAGNGSPLPGSSDSSTDVFVTDGTANGISAVTDVPSGQSASGQALSDDGQVLAFSSSGDFVGENGDHSQELFLARCGSETSTFVDVPAGNAFSGPIEWMAELGIASHPANHRFHPADPATRQQIAVFLYRLAGSPSFTPPATPTFVDVGLGNPARRQIEWLVDDGIASVPANHRFHPADALKRQQLAAFLFNLAGQPLFVPPSTPTFSDVPSSNAFFTQVEWLAAEHIASVPANHLFHPTDAVLRRQMATFLHNFAVFSQVNLA